MVSKPRYFGRIGFTGRDSAELNLSGICTDKIHEKYPVPHGEMTPIGSRFDHLGSNRGCCGRDG